MAKAVRVRVSSSAPIKICLVFVLSLIKEWFVVDFLCAVERVS